MEAHNQCVTNIAKETISLYKFQYEKTIHNILEKEKKRDLEKRLFEVIMKDLKRVGVFTLVNKRLRFCQCVKFRLSL